MCGEVVTSPNLMLLFRERRGWRWLKIHAVMLNFFDDNMFIRSPMCGRSFTLVTVRSHETELVLIFYFVSSDHNHALNFLRNLIYVWKDCLTYTIKKIIMTSKHVMVTPSTSRDCDADSLNCVHMEYKVDKLFQAREIFSYYALGNWWLNEQTHAK
uniref:Uncharacterized protein n=1 Tax=Rhizophagus irregularis (strain DAOM 181602 / DAOM 197198 / MUCL 43194) TaxID=747089 RepID=U9TRN9_RHIID